VQIPMEAKPGSILQATKSNGQVVGEICMQWIVPLIEEQKIKRTCSLLACLHGIFVNDRCSSKCPTVLSQAPLFRYRHNNKLKKQ
jgi:hypothetical protein